VFAFAHYTKANFRKADGALAEHLLFEAKGEFHKQIQVIEEGSLRYLRFGARGGWQGAYNTKHHEQLVFPYQRAFAALVTSLPSIESFLAFGVGTGTALRTVRQVHPGCRLYGVDIEETIIETAVSYFAAPSYDDAQYFVGDGLRFLEQQSIEFNLVFVDAYLRDKIYAPVMDESFLLTLTQRLGSNGIAVFNIIDRFSSRSLQRPFYKTLYNLFPTVIIQPVGLPFTEQNGLVLVSNQQNLIGMWRTATRGTKNLHWYERLIQPHRTRLLSRKQAYAIMR
jgi:spermidine synthase